MGCIQQKQNQRQDVLSAESIDKDRKLNRNNSQKTTHQENKKDVFQIKLNPIVQRRLSPDHRKQSDS
ncbi:unnamed protein product [Paramecium pentaurelia]|uniref:Uncharacterized protein n=1 Tax=Paramecium pentaurelia TaxID=43138 RepID=A0A8S1X745_9CILI|nr:unnamed protein product [Paramecium pentaurelia]